VSACGGGLARAAEIPNISVAQALRWLEAMSDAT
jgi:hypothetical protein